MLTAVTVTTKPLNESFQMQHLVQTELADVLWHKVPSPRYCV